ncbi:universal stress protein [Dactylosporangium sucinum]|uniref:Universal stress protein n=1 Tax=Dactylosporangium sucinum TaxID=1424081 RepID=A0A917UBI3_9ACTN|nr:universal stress protein [Dactylosporangium sucinum]GGM77316.1 universal stress protein [Dactylosporangium sucinum]GGM77869.1 universal stress protein [Dactylosporangium sucinum]
MPIRVLAGYDGSPAASAAIAAAAKLFPRAKAWVANLWPPPFADDALRRRLWTGAAHIDEFVAAVEREGGREAARIAAVGVTLAAAEGWSAEALVAQTYAGEGLQLAELAEQVDADLVLVGSRGLGGARAVLGSVSDMAVHYAARPVLVVPHPLLTAEFAALSAGPVLVGDDGSAGAQAALDTAVRLFPARTVLPVTVDDGQAPGDPQAGGAAPARLHVPSRPGPPGRAVAGALADCAREQDAAVVVVGSRGRSAVREILLGSVAMATLHHAHRPVLVVRTQG